MEREFKALEYGLGQFTFIPQSDEERQQIQRVFKFPPTCELVAEFDGFNVKVRSVLKPEFMKQADATPAQTARQQIAPAQPQIENEDPKIEVDKKVVEELQHMKEKDLITRGGEIGLNLTESMTKTDMAYRIAFKLAEQKSAK